MKKTCIGSWEEAMISGRIILAMRIWTLAEKIHYRKGTVKLHRGKDPITRDALSWLLEGLWHPTSEDLHVLYWLHLPTETISQTLKDRINITQLLFNLSVINSEKISNTSVSQNFKNVEQYISTLSSGGYPRLYFYMNGKLEKLPERGGTVLYF